MDLLPRDSSILLVFLLSLLKHQHKERENKATQNMQEKNNTLYHCAQLTNTSHPSNNNKKKLMDLMDTSHQSAPLSLLLLIIPHTPSTSFSSCCSFCSSSSPSPQPLLTVMLEVGCGCRRTRGWGRAGRYSRRCVIVAGGHGWKSLQRRVMLMPGRNGDVVFCSVLFFSFFFNRRPQQHQ